MCQEARAEIEAEYTAEKKNYSRLMEIYELSTTEAKSLARAWLRGLCRA
jgi:hypothetical protein